MKILFFLLFLNFSYVFTGPIDSFNIFNFWKKQNAVKAYQVQDYDDALEIFHNLMDQDPYNPEYNYNVGDILYKQKKYQDAQSAFLRAAEKAIPSSKLQEQALFNAANSAYQLEAWLQAVQDYQQVLKINEKNQEAQHNLQLALYKLQEQKMQDEEEKQQNQQQDQQQENAQKQQGEQMNDDKSSSQKNSSQDKDCGCEKSQNSGNDDGKSGEKKSEQGSSGNEKEKSQQGNQSKDQKKENDSTDENRENGEQQVQQKKDSEEGKESDQQKGDQQKNKEYQDKGSQDKSDLDNLDAEKLTGTQNQNIDEDETKDDFDQSEQASQDQVEDEKQDTHKQGQNQKKVVGAYKKPELKNELKDEYESKASDDDRLTDYHASVMKTLEDLEEKIQKHVIKNKVAMQGVGQHGKKGW